MLEDHIKSLLMVRVQICCIKDSHSATLTPLYNSSNQDPGPESMEFFENMELDSDPNLNFLAVACLPSVCIWLSHRI